FCRTVVVKRLLPHLAADPEFLDMFLEEARLTARLDHPNIVHVFDLVREEREHFIVMEQVVGCQLAQLIRSYGHGFPPVELGAFVAREICTALSYANLLTDERGARLKLVHRDVSPTNIMVGRNGCVKLLDFGIAKALSSQTSTWPGVILGKMAYMAPERL